MSKINFVTSFADAAYELYGKKFLTHFIDHFPSNTMLHVFYEDAQPDISHPRIRYYELYKEPGITEFFERHMTDPGKNGIFEDAAGKKFVNYRFQATKFARKVFALTSDKLPLTEWLIWIDADVEAKGDIPINFFDNLLQSYSRKAILYLGRKDWDHSECGFVAYNMGYTLMGSFLREFREQYTEDRVFALPQWHDSYVFDRLRERFYVAEQVVNLSEGVEGLDVWPKTVLGRFLIHHKGPQAKSELVKGVELPKQTDVSVIDLMKDCKTRYDQLPKLIEAVKPVDIIEIGTLDGKRAQIMLEQALKHREKVIYYGFDLFEDATASSDAVELNVKPHNSLKEVQNRLESFCKSHSGAEFRLIKGNTRLTLEPFLKDFEGKFDFAFIDGGHSVETIQSDFSQLKDRCKLIALDDYYTDGIDTTKFGCNEVLKNEQHIVLPIEDSFPFQNRPGKQSISIAIAGSLLVGPGGAPQTGKYEVVTRNCVPNEMIHENIRYSMGLQEGPTKSRIEVLEAELERLKARPFVKFIPAAYKPHKMKAVVVGGSQTIRDKDNPFYKDTFDSIRKLRDQGAFIFGVKSSHDELLANDIVPYACLLLDPRDHVAGCFETPLKEIKYFVASMCDPGTFNKLLDAGVDVYGYHASVHAEEDKVISELGGGHLVVGGTTAGIRGLSLLYLLGFRDIEIFGFESSYHTPPAKAHGKSEKPIIEIQLNGRQFITDPELVAQSKDIQIFLEMYPSCQFKAHGDGMLNHAVKAIQARDTVTRKMTEGAMALFHNSVIGNGCDAHEAVYLEGAEMMLRKRKKELQKVMDELPVFQEEFLGK